MRVQEFVGAIVALLCGLGRGFGLAPTIERLLIVRIAIERSKSKDLDVCDRGVVQDALATQQVDVHIPRCEGRARQPFSFIVREWSFSSHETSSVEPGHDLSNACVLLLPGLVITKSRTTLANDLLKMPVLDAILLAQHVDI